MSNVDQIMATLEEYAAAYCDKDLARLMAIFVDGEDISLIGTGADELCSGRAAVEAVFSRNFADATASQFEWTWKDIAIHGPLGTAAVTLNIHLEANGQKHVLPVRWTVSLVYADDRWRWVHRHASAAASGQNEGAAYPVSEKRSA